MARHTLNCEAIDRGRYVSVVPESTMTPLPVLYTSDFTPMLPLVGWTSGRACEKARMGAVPGSEEEGVEA